jgi:hypothetical protein
MIRGYEEQFGKETVNRINLLIERINDLHLPLGVSKYYAVDLIVCLRGGSLIGALIISASLFEMIVREMVIEIATKALSIQDKKNRDLEIELEDKRHLGFKKLIDELKNSGFFNVTDSESAKEYYDNVRIPIQHGLSARFIEKHNGNFSKDTQRLLGMSPKYDWRDFEEVIEDYSLTLIETAIEIIERNSI